MTTWREKSKIWIAALTGAVLLFALPAEAKRSKTFYKTRNCGTVEISSVAEVENDETTGEFLTDTGTVCRADDALTDGDYKTKGAQIHLSVPKTLLDAAKGPQEIMDQILLDLVQKKVKAIHAEAFKWIQTLSTDPELKKDFEEFTKAVFNNKSSPKHQLRQLLINYPDVETEIIREFPEYKPLICRYEVWKHREKTLRTIAKVGGIAGTVALVVGAPIVAFKAIPLLGKYLILVGGAKTLFNGLRIRNIVSSWDNVKAARFAHLQLKMYDDLKKNLEVLKKDPAKNADLITSLSAHLPSSQQIDDLKKINRLEKKQYVQIFTTLLHTAFGVAGVIGGVEALKRFEDFETDAPANIVNPYNPDTGGGGGGPGGDDGG